MAAGSTYTPIATTTLGSAQASYTFSSISGSYTDLRLIVSGSMVGTDSIALQFNGDTGTNYSYTLLYGTGSAAGSARYTNRSYSVVGYGTTAGTTVIAEIQNYSNSTTYKTVLGKGSTADYEVDVLVSCWRSTSAINSILVKCGSGTNLNAGMTLTLYGIQAA